MARALSVSHRKKSERENDARPDGHEARPARRRRKSCRKCLALRLENHALRLRVARLEESLLLALGPEGWARQGAEAAGRCVQ